jgi:hypothetical protein
MDGEQRPPLGDRGGRRDEPTRWQVGGTRQSASTERCNNPNLALSLAQEGQSCVFASQERRTPTLRENADGLAQADHLATTGKPYAPSSWRGCCALDRPQRQRAASARFRKRHFGA